MAVATFTFNVSDYPAGKDNTQRRETLYGSVTIVGDSPSYVAGGNRINFSPLEPIKSVTMLPNWCDVVSLSGSGYIYKFNPLGATITNIALTTNVITVSAKNTLAAGDIVQLSGLTTNTDLNGAQLKVISTGLSATAFEANLTHANISSAADTGFALPITYATGLPFQGKLQIFQSAGSAAPLAELATAAIPAGVVADVLKFKAEFLRAI
jgi:hypothetical protein